MNVSLQRFFLLAFGLLFCVLGCARDRSNVLIPDHVSSPMDIHESVDTVAASFEHDLLPILTANCALSGCHVADGPHGLDFRTYESFIAGGEHGPAFTPGDAVGSEIVEEIVEGRMPPPPRDPLSDAELQVIINWINQQEPYDDIDPHEDAHDDMDEEHDDAHDEDADVEHDDDDDDDDGHDDMDDDHDDNDDDNGHADDEHDDNDDDN